MMTLLTISGFTISGGVPKVGQLQMAAWNLSDVCRFKLLLTPAPPVATSVTPLRGVTSGLEGLLGISPGTSTSNSTPIVPSKVGHSHKENADRIDMPPPPSPASSTCSDTGSTSTSHKRAKRVTVKGDEIEKKDEEEWPLRDVIFVEDVKSVPVGRVLKVDGAYAAVKFTNSTGPAKDSTKDIKEVSSDDTINLLQDCRLLRKDDLQVSRMVHFFTIHFVRQLIDYSRR